MAGAKIPDLSESRKEEREERILNLLKRPKHKDHLGALYTSDKNYSLRDYSVKGGQETSKAGDKT